MMKLKVFIEYPAMWKVFKADLKVMMDVSRESDEGGRERHQKQNNLKRS